MSATTFSTSSNGSKSTGVVPSEPVEDFPIAGFGQPLQCNRRTDRVTTKLLQLIPVFAADKPKVPKADAAGLVALSLLLEDSASLKLQETIWPDLHRNPSKTAKRPGLGHRQMPKASTGV